MRIFYTKAKGMYNLTVFLIKDLKKRGTTEKTSTSLLQSSLYLLKLYTAGKE